jgi:folate-binding protein YgfZ
VEARGKDAGDFLHRVTAGTVKGVPVGQGRPGLLLDGRSRVLAQFDLLRLEDQAFALAAPLACAEGLAAALEALHFSEDLEIRLTEARAGAVRLPEARRAESQAFPVRAAPAGPAWPSPVPGFEFSSCTTGAPEGWDFARIGALVPWPGSEWESGANPALEAGMLPWIDRGKGCYPGQEVVELSLNVGHPARILVAFEGAAPVEPGEGAVVTSRAQENGIHRAFVRVPWANRDFLPPGTRSLASPAAET